MDFLRSKGLLSFIYLFAGLLVLSGVLAIYNQKVAAEQSTGATSSEVQPESMPTDPTQSEPAVDSAEFASSLRWATILQIILVVGGLPFLIVIYRQLQKRNAKLQSLSRDIDESNRKYVFDSLTNTETANEAEVKADLLNNLKKASEFIKAMSNGDYSIQWEGMNDGNRSANSENIAGELIQMRDQMKAMKEQDQIRLWTTEGLSKFGEIIRNQQDNFDKLAESLVSNVVKYVDAKVGGLFILEAEEGNRQYLALRASYAYGRKKYLNKRVEIGEGLIGQSYIEGHTIFLTKVPNEYVSITSGLGEANPRSILVIPLKANDKIEGVLELASLQVFKPHEIQFLEKLGEMLASSIVSVRTNEKTSVLLQVSQEQSEEMRAQEEEMRQNMEELEATQEQMNRSVGELAAIKESLEKEKYLLDALMDNLPDAIYFKDRDSKFLRVSKYLADHFNDSVEGLIGKSDFDFQERSRAQEAFDDELNIMTTRNPKIDYIEREVTEDGAEHWVSTTKMPLVNHQGQVVGTFGVSRDISKLKRLEADFKDKEKRLNQIEKEYHDKLTELESKLKSKEQELEKLKKS
jgi:PAS domain S-box-containing protein